MAEDIGSRISKMRADMGLTQDQFGRKYGVSGPAIFKFEKGYVKPSLDLWLSMARDMNLSEQTAVLMHCREKLPRKYQEFIELEPKAVSESSKAQEEDPLAKMTDPEKMRDEIVNDRSAPTGLKQLLRDDDLWALYQPKPKEIVALRNIFGKLGKGSKSAYREALRLVREFGGEA